MDNNNIEKHFKAQIDCIDQEILAKINTIRNDIINGKSLKDKKAFLPKYAIASIVPCFLALGLYLSQTKTVDDELMLDLLLDNTYSESYVYETTNEEFEEMLSFNSVYKFNY